MTKFKERGRPYVSLYRGLWHCARSDTEDRYTCNTIKPGIVSPGCSKHKRKLSISIIFLSPTFLLV